MPLRTFWVGLCFLWMAGAQAQPLQIQLYSSADSALIGEAKVVDSTAAEIWVQRAWMKYQSQGFIEASIDSIERDTASWRVYLYVGNNYQWQQLFLSMPEGYASILPRKIRQLEGKRVSPEEVRQWYEALLQAAENRGYPFARLWLDSVSVEGQQFSATLRMQEGRRVMYDSLRIAGDLPLKPWVLARYLQLREGEWYDERQVRQINRRINALPYARQTAASQLYFYNQKASWVIHAAKRPVSSFDGMLGLFPGAGGNGVLLTGDLNLLLWSALKRGERIALSWRSLQPGTQDLRAGLRWPFLFRSPVGLDSDFRLFRRDSSFLEVQGLLGLEYTFSAGNYLKGYWQQRNYRLLDGAPAAALTQGRVDGQLYGLEYSLQQVDKAFNPYRGWQLVVGAGAGNREISVANGSENTSRRVPQYSLQLDAQFFIPVRKRWQAYVSLMGKGLWSDQLFAKEQFRLGGFKTLRGFDEEGLQATRFLLWNVEQRYLLDANSWLYAFANGGWLGQQLIDLNQTDRPIGAGLGLTFQNKSGIFNIAYAVGSSATQQFRVSNAKVHLGYRYLL